MQAGLSTQNAPSVWVVAPHFLLGTVSFVIAALLMVFHSGELLGYHLTPQVLAIVHLMILGWISLVIFGALYQLIPVVMEVKIYSEKLAFATLAVLIFGLIFLVIGFVDFKFKISHNISMGATFIIIAVILFALNTLKSAASSTKKSISRDYIIASGLYLLLNVSYALFMVLNMSYHYVAVPHTELLKAHLIVGLGGWFLMLIIGVSVKLMPMFLIVHKLKEHYLRWGFYLMNAGILSVFTLVWFNYPSVLFGVALVPIIAGIVLYLMFTYDVFKRRMRKKLDSGMKPTAISIIIFLFSMAGFVMLYFGDTTYGLPAGRLEIISGTLLIYGFFTGIILGQTYKTLPFIIWLFHYQKLVGKQKTPLPGELFNEKLAALHTWTFVVSVVLLTAGLVTGFRYLVAAGTWAVLLTSLIYGYNVSKMIFHRKVKTNL